MIRITTACALALAIVAAPALAETKGELWRSGYNIVWEGYASVEECTPDDAIKLGSYVFVCDGYEYPYHYGDVYLAAKTFAYGGRSITSYYLCLDDDDENECFDGQVYRR